MKKTIETKRTSITEYIPKYACEVCNQIFSSAYDALDHVKNNWNLEKALTTKYGHNITKTI